MLGGARSRRTTVSRHALGATIAAVVVAASTVGGTTIAAKRQRLADASASATADSSAGTRAKRMGEHTHGMTAGAPSMGEHTQSTSRQARGAGARAPSMSVRAQDASVQAQGTEAQTFAVGLRVLRLVDTHRTIRLPGGRSEPRTLITYIRYPARGPASANDVLHAPAAGGPHPLIVFAHGFDVTPALYVRLLRSWARAGFVVAAPVFPLTSAHTPGGPEEADVVNQPRDLSFAISSLLASSAARSGPLAGSIDPARIAVAGHSDGGETALASAYSRRFHDSRVRAAVILSGAEMSGVGGYDFTDIHVPLLAAQGTADRFNEPRYTYEYFDSASAPKFLLRLPGAGHLPPFSFQEPQLGIVERVTAAFLEGYLDSAPAMVRRLSALGDVARTSTLIADP